jgi:hypothetical protein
LPSARLKIVKVSGIKAPLFFAFLREWERRGERIVPYAIERKGRCFREMAAQRAFDETEEVREKGFVTATRYFLLGKGGRVIGACISATN